MTAFVQNLACYTANLSPQQLTRKHTKTTPFLPSVRRNNEACIGPSVTDSVLPLPPTLSPVAPHALIPQVPPRSRLVYQYLASFFSVRTQVSIFLSFPYTNYYRTRIIRKPSEVGINNSHRTTMKQCIPISTPIQKYITDILAMQRPEIKIWRAERSRGNKWWIGSIATHQSISRNIFGHSFFINRPIPSRVLRGCSIPTAE